MHGKQPWDTGRNTWSGAGRVKSLSEAGRHRSEGERDEGKQTASRARRDELREGEKQCFGTG